MGIIRVIRMWKMHNCRYRPYIIPPPDQIVLNERCVSSVGLRLYIQNLPLCTCVRLYSRHKMLLPRVSQFDL